MGIGNDKSIVDIDGGQGTFQKIPREARQEKERERKG